MNPTMQRNLTLEERIHHQIGDAEQALAEIRADPVRYGLADDADLSYERDRNVDARQALMNIELDAHAALELAHRLRDRQTSHIATDACDEVIALLLGIHTKALEGQQ